MSDDNIPIVQLDEASFKAILGVVSSVIIGENRAHCTAISYISEDGAGKIGVIAFDWSMNEVIQKAITDAFGGKITQLE